jgi:hypothetical protein
MSSDTGGFYDFHPCPNCESVRVHTNGHFVGGVLRGHSIECRECHRYLFVSPSTKAADALQAWETGAGVQHLREAH